jgi:Autotransporter beta-domain
MPRGGWIAAMAGIVMAVVFGQSQSAMAACTYGACAPSNIIVANQVTQYATTQTAGLITDQINQAVGALSGVGAFITPNDLMSYADSRAPGPFFKAAPGAVAPPPRTWNVWAAGAGLSVHDSQQGANYDGSISSGVGGFDYRWNGRVLAGLATGYEGVGLNTGFNTGNLKSNGYVLAPYMAYLFTPSWSVDAQLGHGWLNYNESHPGVTGSFNANRWWGQVNLNDRQVYGNWHLGASLGYIYVSENQNAYSESNGNPVAGQTLFLGQIRLKGLAGYEFLTPWGALMPYGSARLEFDVQKSALPIVNSLAQTTTNGNFGTTFGLGILARVGPATTMSVEGTTTQFRTDFQSYGIKGILRWTW